MMPPDNAATVAPGTDVSFPQDGPSSGADISRTGPESFNLAQIGTYQIRLAEANLVHDLPSRRPSRKNRKSPQLRPAQIP